MAFDSDEDTGLLENVYYKPCKFCGSIDYDLADGQPEEREDGMFDFEPTTCDVCNYGAVAGGTLTKH